MEHKKIKADYSKLKRKLLLQMLGLLVGAAALIFSLYIFVWAGRGANFVVAVFQRLFNFNYQAALEAYNYYIRGNAGTIFLVAFAISLLGYLYFFISRFTRYFNQITDGIDALVQEDTAEISLLPELLPIEQKLNTVRQSLKERAAAAKEAERRKNELVMYLAHDIRTPLTSIIGYLSLLDEAPDMPAPQKAKYVGITLEKSLRLEKLVDEFFEITRYNSQHIALQTENIDLHYMLIQLLDEFYPILAKGDNSAVLNAPEDLTVCGDTDKLARVFNNLLKNAAAYSIPGTQIIVDARQDDKEVCINFCNQSHAILPQKLDALFDKFYRLDSSRATATGGAGLGLSIAKEIVEAHGGSIFAQSNDGRITFTVCLPATMRQSS